MEHEYGCPNAEVILVDINEINEQYNKNRKIFFKELHTAQEQADLMPEEADVITQEAVQAIRDAKVRR